MAFSELSITPSFTSFLANFYSLLRFVLFTMPHITAPLCHYLLTSWSLFIQMTFASTLATTSTPDYLLDTNEQFL